MPPLRVFYSWQADLSDGTTRSFIAECHDQAAKELATKGEITVQTCPERKPANAATILKMIGSCDLFVCDLTFQGSSEDRRGNPNPDVLFELGYAVKSLGWDQVVGIVNEAFGDVDFLPFHVDRSRVFRYCLYDNQEKSEQQALLVRHLKEAMNTVLESGAAPAKDEPQTPEIHDDFASTQRLRILVVEDDHIQRTILKQILKKLGYPNVVEATDGPQALKVLTISKPNIVITDWNMPKASGIELVTRIRRQNPTIPIIMMTAHSEKALVVEAVKAGVNDFIVKPVEPELLAAKLRKVIREMGATF